MSSRSDGQLTRVEEVATTCYPDLIFDVGMHTGEDTEFYLKKGFRVVGFEADPDLVESSHERFSVPLRDGQLQIVSGAIVPGDCHKKVKLYRYRNTLLNTVLPGFAERAYALGETPRETIEVEPINFTRALKHFGVPYYLKIDIEGTDRTCLGALSSPKLKPRYVSIEAERKSLFDLLSDFAQLEDLGYRRFKVVQQATIAGTSAPNPAREGLSVDHVFREGSSGRFGRDLAGPWTRATRTKLLLVWVLLGHLALGPTSSFRRLAPVRLLLRVLDPSGSQTRVGWHDLHAARTDDWPA